MFKPHRFGEISIPDDELLIDKKMKKKDLIVAAGISPSTMAKFGKDEYVSIEVLVQVCIALGVNIGDVMDVVDTAPLNQHKTMEA